MLAIDTADVTVSWKVVGHCAEGCCYGKTGKLCGSKVFPFHVCYVMATAHSIPNIFLKTCDTFIVMQSSHVTLLLHNFPFYSNFFIRVNVPH